MNHIGVPMLMQITDHLYAMRPMKEPATAAWGLRISDTDAEKLKAGFQPLDQDDKWHIYVSTTEPATSVHIARSAFGVETYVVHVVEKTGDEGSSAEIASITWETNKGGIRISEEQAKKEVVNLTRSILECDYETLPYYDPADVWNYPKADLSNNINGNRANEEH
jgi:hypothetical protein